MSSKKQPAENTLASGSIAIVVKKSKQFQDKLDELMDEFSANDEGDIELRDVHPFMIDALKIM